MSPSRGIANKNGKMGAEMVLHTPAESRDFLTSRGLPSKVRARISIVRCECERIRNCLCH